MLGLFLGASVFTIIDFVRYTLNYTYKEFKSRYNTHRTSAEGRLSAESRRNIADISSVRENIMENPPPPPSGEMNSRRESSSCSSEDENGRTSVEPSEDPDQTYVEQNNVFKII